MHPRVESTAQKAPGLGIMPGGEELPLGQGSSEGGRTREQQQNGAGDKPAGPAAKQEEHTGHRRERGDRGAYPPKQLCRHKGSSIPKECAASTYERSAQKQAKGEKEYPDGLPRHSLGEALPYPG